MGSGASKSGGPPTVAQSPTADAGPPQEKIKMDSRLPYTDFRELFTLKNYWKTVRRNDVICGKTMLHK